MIIESVRIAVRPAKREEFRRVLISLTGPTGVVPGCESCRILQDVVDPCAFYYEGRWKSRDELFRHLRSDLYKRLLTLLDMGDEPPIVEFHIVAETYGLGLIQQARNVA
jgi:quinol monooxygenase YgiN